MKNVLKLAIVLIIFYWLPANCLAQTGEIYGVVSDKETNETIIGANVVIKGTTTGSSTDLDGFYRITNLQPGEYEIQCSFISYTTEYYSITVGRGEKVELNIKMESDAFVIEEMVVTAQRIISTELSLLNTIRTSDVVLSGISAQQIKRSQDSDAAEVVKRVPGVNIAENRFINIRGLSERYNAVLLHDVFAPSMETDVRAFSFDIVPSSLIDRILIFKSPSPELPGDFSGGVVKIYTKSIPDENSISAGISTSYREGTAFNDFSYADKGNWHFTGFNNGYYDLPGNFPDDLRKVENDFELIDESGRVLKNSWVPNTANSYMNYSGSLNINRRFRLSSGRFAGTITSITYNNSKSITDISRRDFNAYDQENDIKSVIYDFNDNRHRNNISLGILHNWALSLNANNMIEFKNLFNQLSASEYVHRSGMMHEFDYYANNHSFHQIYRGIYSGQLTGNHKLSGKSSFDWVGAYGYSYRDEPDYRRFRSDLDTISGHSTLYVPFGAAQPFFLGRYYSNMKEHNISFSGNYMYNIDISHHVIKPVINTGLFAERKTRDFLSRNIGYVRSSLTGFDNGLLDVPIDSLFNPANINQTTGIKIDEQSNPSDSYTAANNLIAGYVSLFIPLTERINISGGARIEHNTQRLNSHTLTNDPINVENIDLSILPSVNLSIGLTDEMLVRLAYGKTVNRPEFRELAPFGFYDFNYNLVKKGSDSINVANIHNYDLRWEYYPGGADMINVGVFYKRFINPIETTFVPGGGTAGIKTFTYANAERATSRGVEIEVRKSLSGILNSSIIDNLSIILNSALIQSEVELGAAALGQNVEKRAMYGQAPYMFNAGLFYHSAKNNLTASLLYNVIGKRIYIIGYDDYPDIYEMPRNMLDFTLTKTFNNNLEIKFGIKNILDAEVLLMQDANQDGIFDKKTDQILQIFNEGRNFSLGISYSF